MMMMIWHHAVEHIEQDDTEELEYSGSPAIDLQQQQQEMHHHQQMHLQQQQQQQLYQDEMRRKFRAFEENDRRLDLVSQRLANALGVDLHWHSPLQVRGHIGPIEEDIYIPAPSKHVEPDDTHEAMATVDVDADTHCSVCAFLP
jgi:hydroxymethylpyrimidine pyrophosphatase-like HAD family hydrolase